MSLFKWFTPHRKKADVPMTSGLSRLDSTRPFRAARPAGTAQPGNRKQERLERREMLYAVVREAMVRAGVLSSSYKFKVLSLDPRGQQFLVMVDLSRAAGTDTNRLAEIEAMIAQTAKARHDILVTAVYWRANDHVAVGDPQPATRGGSASRPAPLEADVSGPAPLMEAPSAPAPLARAPLPVYEPLQEDEVAAFKKALSAGVRGEQALAAVNKDKPAQSYTLLTGFEDTEMVDNGPAEHLSSTQYGALR